MINFQKFINENINEAFNFSKEEVLKVAHLVAHAIEKLDKAPTRVHDLEYDKGRGAGFGIQMYADQFAGGAYTVLPNGDVVNDAIGNSFPNAIYAKIGDTDVKKVMKNIQKFESVMVESVVNEKIKITKDEWPYIEFKDGGKKHKVEFDYEDIIDDHGNEGQDQYWIGKDEDGQEWSIDVYADYRGEVEEVHYDTLVKESLNEAKKFYSTKEIAKISNAAGGIVVDAKYAIQDLGVAYGDKVPAKELDKVLTNYDLEIEDLTESIVTEGTLKISGPAYDGWNDRDIQKKLNNIKIRIVGDIGGVLTIAGSDEELQKVKDILGLDESVVTEGKKVTLKRRYTENYPAITAGKHARIRNKMLEAISDGKITQEEFDSILKELSNNGKRWTRNNSKYFNVSEEGISLSKFGKRVLQSITVNEEQPETNDKPLEMKVNEKTTKNPEIWVPGAFDKELSKMPNDQITYDVVKKLAKKHKVFLDDAIKYVEYGWMLDLQESKESFVYEAFNDFVNTLDESQSYASSFGGSSEKIDAVEIKKALKKAGYKTDTGGFWDRIFVKKGSNKIAMINTSDNMYRFNNSFYKWNGLNDFINHVSESVNEGKFQKDDLVYNTRTKTVGIVRIGDDEYGEVKTDADGNVDVDELEKYNPIKFKHQTKAKVAPSTEKEVSKRGLFNPFKNESVNEAKYTNQTGIKSALMKDSNFSSLLNPKEIKWINGSDVKIYKGIGMNFSFTDGKSQMIVNVNKPMSIVKKLGRAGNDIKKIYQQK